MKTLLLSIVTISFMLSSCQAESTKNSNIEEIDKHQTGTLSSVAWIEGVWIDSTTLNFRVPPQQLIEEWTLYPDSLSGVGKSVVGLDTMITERLTILMVNEKLTYIARPINRTLISFASLITTDSLFVVENLVNEFPSKISYIKKGSGALDINMQGSHNSVPQELVNHFVKG